MKTKEFIKRVEELGFEVESIGLFYRIKNKNDLVIAAICKNVLLQINTNYLGWEFVDEEDKTKLFNLFFDYAKTPIGNRGEKKFYFDLANFKLVEVE